MTQQNDQTQREPEDTLDKVLRSEMHWEAPPSLCAHLGALIQYAPALMAGEDVALPPFSQQAQTIVIQPQPKRWYTTLVTMLTVVAIAVSVMVAWQLYGTVGEELGLTNLWLSVSQTFADINASIFRALPPQASYVLQLLAGVRTYLYWLLLVAVLWLALDGVSPNFSLRQQQTS